MSVAVPKYFFPAALARAFELVPVGAGGRVTVEVGPVDGDVVGVFVGLVTGGVVGGGVVAVPYEQE